MDEFTAGLVAAVMVALISLAIWNVGAEVRTSGIVHACKNYGKYEYKADKWIKCEVEK